MLQACSELTTVKQWSPMLKLLQFLFFIFIIDDTLIYKFWESLDSDYLKSAFLMLRFLLFFFFWFSLQWLTGLLWIVLLCTVYRSHKLHFLSTFSLKMGSTALFTYLKIILLQCFQFSIFSFSKISPIQTDPLYGKIYRY